MAMIELQGIDIKVEAMQLSDISEVMEIEHTAFPLPWPAHAYRYELMENDHSFYFVARFLRPPAAEGKAGLRAYLRRSIAAKKPFPIVGYGGFWMMYDEAHISTLAVRPEWRHRGIGELLLLFMLERALEMKAQIATLEVRVSNKAAQALYHKYQFKEVGLRHRYYSDNGEDAILMSVEHLRSPAYREFLKQHESAIRARLLSSLRPGRALEVDSR
jgi:ribosomal-protein-alanine N-acetyltransferase